VAATPPARLRVGADDVVVRASTADTGGALFAAEVHMAPGGGPPFMHRHARGELYHVLEGELTFYLEDDDGTIHRRTAAAGAVVPITGRQPHTIRNESQAGATAIAVYAPGEPMERFARAAAALARDGAPEPRAVAELAARHGIEATGPLPPATTP
jgi:mannose-6-phosphate isomerase-like protein (cupin superfamily)